jgi:hypothetical protein
MRLLTLALERGFTNCRPVHERVAVEAPITAQGAAGCAAWGQNSELVAAACFEHGLMTPVARSCIDANVATGYSDARDGVTGAEIW